MINIRKLTILVLEKVRENALDEVPVGKGKGGGKLRNDIIVKYLGEGRGAVGAYNVPYAAAVHNGRKALTIRPNLEKNPPLGNRVIKGSKESYRPKARLKFMIGGQTVFAKEVKQKARAANPFLTRAVDKLQSEGFQFLATILKKEVSDDVAKNLIKKIEIDFSL